MLVAINTYEDTLQQKILHLNIDGVAGTYIMNLRWAEIISKWLMTVERDNGEVICTNIPIVGGQGYCNLLEEFGYKLPGSIACIIQNVRDQVPDQQSLTSACELVWGDYTRD